MEHFFLVYGGALLTAFFLTLFFLTAIIFIHKQYFYQQTAILVSRLGGGALILSFLLTLWLNPSLHFPVSWWVFSGVLLAALLVGWWDDFKNISWQYQLLAQAGFLIALYLGGVQILTLTHPQGGVFSFEGTWLTVVGFAIFIAWGILIFNTINWLDGVDGLCGSVMFVVYGSLFILSLSPLVYQPALAILSVAALGVTGAFLICNYPPAKIIGGTSGSLFFGLVVIFVSVVAGTKIATTLLVLALPITDTFFVLIKRFLQKRSLFQSDQEHLHHILQRNGWSKQRIVGFYTLLTALIAGLALSTETLGKFTAIISVFIILGVILTFFHFRSMVSGKVFVLVGIVLSLCIAGVFLAHNTARPSQNIFVEGQWYKLEVAKTPLEREAGLSDRENLCPRCGMLFLFSEPVKPSFWMKNMQFSIDILWIQENRVVAKHENLPYPSLQTFSPGTLVTKVIELPAGAAHDIPIGAKIYFW